MLLIITSLWYGSGHTFEFIKAVSDTVLDIIKAAYYAKPLIFIRTMFREKLVTENSQDKIECKCSVVFCVLPIMCA